MLNAAPNAEKGCRREKLWWDNSKLNKLRMSWKMLQKISVLRISWTWLFWRFSLETGRLWIFCSKRSTRLKCTFDRLLKWKKFQTKLSTLSEQNARIFLKLGRKEFTPYCMIITSEGSSGGRKLGLKGSLRVFRGTGMRVWKFSRGFRITVQS